MRRTVLAALGVVVVLVVGASPLAQGDQPGIAIQGQQTIWIQLGIQLAIAIVAGVASAATAVVLVERRLTRLETQMGHLSTKEDVAAISGTLRTDLANNRTDAKTDSSNLRTDLKEEIG